MSEPILSVIADVHVGNHRLFGGATRSGINERCELVLKALAGAVESVDSGVLVIAGDLFDSATPSPTMIANVMHVLSERPIGASGDVIVLCGNHDRTSAGCSALDPLAYCKGVRVIRETTTISTRLHYPVARHPRQYKAQLREIDMVLVPFHPGPAHEWLARELDFPSNYIAGLKRDSIRVLITHVGVSNADTPAYLAGSDDSIDVGVLMELMAKHAIDHAFVGNWHNPAHWEQRDDAGMVLRTVTQVGALCPTGFANPGVDYGQVATLVPANPHMVGPPSSGMDVRLGAHVAHPTFHRVLDRNLSSVPRSTSLHPTYVRMVTTAEFAESAAAVAALAVIEKTITGFDVQVVAEDPTEAIEAITGSVASGAGLDEVTRVYVRETCPLGIEPERVIEIIRTALQGGPT